jgi:hypothetical protein
VLDRTHIGHEEERDGGENDPELDNIKQTLKMPSKQISRERKLSGIHLL